MQVSTIDHLPTLLPKESSDRYCQDLLPSIQQLAEVRMERRAMEDDLATHRVFPPPQIDTAPVWQRALKLFHEKVALAKQD